MYQPRWYKYQYKYIPIYVAEYGPHAFEHDVTRRELLNVILIVYLSLSNGSHRQLEDFPSSTASRLSVGHNEAIDLFKTVQCRSSAVCLCSGIASHIIWMRFLSLTNQCSSCKHFCSFMELLKCYLFFGLRLQSFTDLSIVSFILNLFLFYFRHTPQHFQLLLVFIKWNAVYTVRVHAYPISYE